MKNRSFKMPPNKTRDELAKELWEEHKNNHDPIGQARLYYADNGQYFQFGVKAALDAAEKQYLDEIEELKFKLMDRSEKYKIAMDKGVMELSDQVESLKADLEMVVNAINIALEIPGVVFREHCKSGLKHDLVVVRDAMKSKLGGERG
jgi:hypothetical protein